MRSMTGYGRAKDYGITVEIKAVNHRYLDIYVKTPRLYVFLEETVKNVVSKWVSRGKIEVGVSFEPSAVKNVVSKWVSRGKIEVGVSFEPSAVENVVISVNNSVLESFVAAAKEIENKYGLKNDISVMSLLRMPEVAQSQKNELNEDELTQKVAELTELAVKSFNEMRLHEGTRLKDDILQKCFLLEKFVTAVEARSPVTVLAYRQRLTAKLKEVLENTAIDESRILTEAAIFADKVSVDEETVRIRSHIAALREMLKDGGIIGRKLDFLAQEFAREANTIGSKGNDIEMGRIVVELKTEIEKIREQVQNIE